MAEKDCFLGDSKEGGRLGVDPLLGVGFVYDTPLKNFPPF